MRGLFSMRTLPAAAVSVLAASGAQAAEGLNGAAMPIAFAIPFAGILLSIALCPLFVQRWWHAHYGRAAAFWSIAGVAPLLWSFGAQTTAEAVFHTLALEYLPFILMLLALFTAAGGVVVHGNLRGSPVVNTLLLASGSVLASIIGTTGAAMLLIRPLLRANDNRRDNAHVFIFIIFVVANIGGALSPLGDPPLFLGFLRGVDFFWTTRNLFQETIFALAFLLALFFLIDVWFHRREGDAGADPTPRAGLRLTGVVNIFLLAVAIGAIILSGVWKPGIEVTILGSSLPLQNLVREATMIGVCLASIALTDGAARRANGFDWEPIREVAKLFSAIFICIIPVMAMLQAGDSGAFAKLLSLVARADGGPDNVAYFWLTGLLSSLLDNAPTYLVFFQLAGGDPARLMGPLADTLAAISLGAVFMGAMTYVGNAPNFMVYAIARDANIRMPGFFGYMLWSAAILGPLFVLVTWLFVR